MTRAITRLSECDGQLEEVRAQQSASADILRTISSCPAGLPKILAAIAERAGALCGARDVIVWQVTGRGLSAAAVFGPLVAHYAIGRGPDLDDPAASVWAMRTGQSIHIHDMRGIEGAQFPDSRDAARRLGFRTAFYVPLMRFRSAIGLISIHRAEVLAFTERQIALLNTFADQAVIAIENARLFSELHESNRTLKAALEQQTATSDVLRVIASFPTDPQRVLDTITESAASLTESPEALIRRLEGDQLRGVARYGTSPSPWSWGATTGLLRLLDHGWVGGRTVMECKTIHVPDLNDRAYGDFPVSR